MSTDLRPLAPDRLPASNTPPIAPSQGIPRSFKEEFPYGWRYVEVSRPDGSIEVEQIPLTLEDALHPQEDDQIPSNLLQNEVVRSIRNALDSLLRDRDDVLIFNDMLIDWGKPGIKAMSPDIVVFFGGKLASWVGTYRVPEQGVTTEVVIEVTSPSTRSNDVEKKVVLYAQCGVPRYVIVDARYDARGETLQSLELKDYRAVGRVFELAPPDESGVVWLERLGLGLVVEGTTLRCLDGEGRPIETDFAEEREAREEAERRAHEEAVAKEAAERRVREESLAKEAAERRAHEEAVAKEAAERRAHEEAVAKEAAERRAAAAERRALDEAAAKETAERTARDEALARRQAEERIQQLEQALRLARGEA